MVNYTLKRSIRKTIAIHIRDGKVEVRSPIQLQQHEIDRFVNSKLKWVERKLAESIEKVKKRENFTLNYGEHILYRGKMYPITEKQGDRIGFDNESFYMPPGMTPDQIKSACIKIYRQLAKRYITERTLKFSDEMCIMPSAIRINNARSRWGSCTSNESVNFSWLLIMAEDEVIDYIVVHELAHLVQLNHSACYWGIVKRTMPDYAQRKVKLKELQDRIACEDW